MYPDSGSRSVGSVCFWASRIRIRHYLYGSGSVPYSSINKQKKTRNLDLYYFLAWFLLLPLKTDVNGVPSKSNSEITSKPIYYFVGILSAFCQPLTKKADPDA